MIERILKFNGKATHREIEINGELQVLDINDIGHEAINKLLNSESGKENYSIRNSVISFNDNTGVKPQIEKNLEAHIYRY